MDSKMKPMVVELINGLSMDTNSNDLKWIEESFSSGKRSERFYKCSLSSGTEIQVKVGIKDDLSMGDGWMIIRDPKLSESVSVFISEIPEVIKIITTLYSKFILPEKVKIQEKNENDLKVLGEIVDKTSILNRRDRKLEEIIGNDIDKIKDIFK